MHQLITFLTKQNYVKFSETIDQICTNSVQQDVY